MSFHAEDSGRIGQSAYWMYFGAYMIATPLLLVGGGYELITGKFGTGIICFILMLVGVMYFRVIVMRRCRDIGWPAFLPWVTLVLQMGIGFMNGLSAGLDPVARHHHMATSPSLGLPLVLGFVDLIMAIVVGCIGSKQGFNAFDDHDFDYRSLPQAPRPITNKPNPGAPTFRARPTATSSVEPEADAGVAAVSPTSRPTTSGFGRRTV